MYKNMFGNEKVSAPSYNTIKQGYKWRIHFTLNIKEEKEKKIIPSPGCFQQGPDRTHSWPPKKSPMPRFQNSGSTFFSPTSAPLRQPFCTAKDMRK